MSDRRLPLPPNLNQLKHKAKLERMAAALKVPVVYLFTFDRQSWRARRKVQRRR
jgi:hypothetical protein